MKKKHAALLGSILGFFSVGVLVWELGWIPGIAVFLMIYANNLERSNRS